MQVAKKPVGFGFSISAIGLFAEVGYVPYYQNDTLYSVLEGRAGASLSF